MAGPQGQFAGQSDIEDQFGVVNVAIWSNLDNTNATGGIPTANVTRIQAGLDWADARINHLFFVQGNYVTPVVAEGTDVVLFRRWAAILAGTWLYLSRGLRDGDGQGNHLKRMQDDAVAEMMVSRGKEKLNAGRRWPVGNSPVGYEAKG